MAKDTFYFSHDYNVRNDAKIKKLLSKHKYEGYGIFWAIIEDLYNNANALPLDYDTIAYDLRADKKVVESIIKDFDLFVFEGVIFGSLSVQKRLEERNSKSVKARESALKRWNKDANALPPQSEPNAIKERKGKEINKSKVIKIQIRESVFLSEIEVIKLQEFYLTQYDNALDILNNYKMSSGKKYKSDYHAMLGWVSKRITETLPEKGKIEKIANAGQEVAEYFKNRKHE
jgi:hypothetical protein